MPPLKESPLQHKIEHDDVFDRDDVSHVCPDEKKVIINPNNFIAEPVF